MPASQIRFEEKILYKTHQHWIILLKGLVGPFFLVLFLSLIIWFFVEYSLLLTTLVSLFIFGVFVAYHYYLWSHSWLFIGNQKITLSVRNGVFSQYAMNIRYRNIRDCAVSKNNLFSFLFKYGTLFLRSNGAEGDFTALYVPKVGKVYALINALSRYSDDDRMILDSIEKLHIHHTKKEFSSHQEKKENITPESAKDILSLIPGVVGVVDIGESMRGSIKEHEEARNHGVMEVLTRKHVVCILHDSSFRLPSHPIVHHMPSGEIIFPPVPFPEIPGDSVVSASPGDNAHDQLKTLFPYIKDGDASVLIGWNE